MAATHREDVRRVLYVDDDPVSRRIFEQLGKIAHVVVDACGSLDEAFAFARQHPYSGIAADYSLRRWDGLSVLRELSALQPLASLMLVTDPERKRELPSSLLKYVFVEKPIRRSEVLAQLNDALAAHEERAHASHAALSAPILLLASDAEVADRFARGVAEHSHGRMRVTRAAGLEAALNMLKSVSFAAALIDGGERTGETRDLVEGLLAQAPSLPLVVLAGEHTLRYRQALAGRLAQVTVVRREASAELVVHVLCSAVERATRQREIIALSQNDLTTGARNRPTFCALLTRRVEQRLPFVLACFGVEGLGDINETHGHIRGDAVLAASVSRLAREVAPSATLGRLGGSMFAVLADSIGPETELAVDRAIRQVFELPFDLSDSQVRVSVQVATVEFPRDGRGAEELLREAERSLRVQKAQSLRRRSTPPPPLAHHP